MAERELDAATKARLRATLDPAMAHRMTWVLENPRAAAEYARTHSQPSAWERLWDWLKRIGRGGIGR